MQKPKFLKLAKYATTAVIATKLLFSSFCVLAEPPREKATFSAFVQYDAWYNAIRDSRSALGIGASYSFKTRRPGSPESNSIEAGLFALAGKKMVLDEAYIKYGWAGRWSKSTLSLLKNSSQKIGWGIEAGHFIGKSILFGATATALEVPEEPARMQFYLKPAIEAEQGFLKGKLSFIINYVPGKSPFIYAKGAEAYLCASNAKWSFFASYASLERTSGSLPPADSPLQRIIFTYVRAGIKYEF